MKKYGIIAAMQEEMQEIKKIMTETEERKIYELTFTKGKIIYDSVSTTSNLSDEISKDLTKRGMKFTGSTIIHSYLQAIGIINSHEKQCFLCKKC